MSKLLMVFIPVVILAYVSENTTKAIKASGHRYSIWKDGAYIALLVILVLFAGLRTNYNDTGNYIGYFRSAPTIQTFLSDPENLNPFTNPLFYSFESLLITFTDNAQILIFTTAAFTQICIVRFVKRYSENFTFSIFIYFTLGTFVFTLAAIKQVLAMAILTLAFPYLEEKKWGKYYVVVLLAMLVHTYAITFAVLPLFRVRPWRKFTYVFVVAVVVVMMNFETAITAFMEQANDLGKTIADYEIFDDATINVFRLAVYAVPPVLSLIFQKWVMHNNSKMDNVMIHMSIISLAFMSMGTQSGANMFARMAMYFEMGTICCLPRILKKTFEDRSYRVISTIAIICFFVFFIYANSIAGNFDQEYRSIFS